MRFLLLIAFLAKMSLQACDQNPIAYKCSAEKLVDDKCLIIDDNFSPSIYYLQNCQKDQTCKKGVDKIGYCVEKFRYFFKGEKCGINAECYSNFCNQGICSFSSDPQTCTKHEQCSSTSYCSNKLCTSLLTVNSRCEQDYECQAGLACGSTSEDGSNKVCKKMFSIAVGQYSTNRLLCESGFIYSKPPYNPFNKNAGFCSISNITSTDACTVDKDCKYTIHGTSNLIDIQGSCGCSSDGKTGYCSIWTEHEKWKNWVTQYKKVIENLVIEENQNPFYLRENNWGILKLMQADSDINNYPKLMNADECAIRFISSSELINVSYVFLNALFVLLF